MKTLIKIAIIAVMITAGTALKAQDLQNEYLGLPGDNLNLYAVMNTFQESNNLRAFERNLNDPDRRINNLDLNGDNLVDYIMVSDNVDRYVHYIILRVAINRRESQDVAVFTVQRLDNGQVYVQLTGDEALYGKNYIIEPAGQVLLADWPLVRNIFRSNYTVWQSDWYWGYYPDYWTPWRPSYWHFYYGYHYNWNNYYYTCYHRSYAHYDRHWNDFYYTRHRVWSPVVTHNVYAGNYRGTYSHPEKLREGEDQYRNRYPEQGRRSTYSTNTASNVTRSNNSTVTGRRTTGSVTTARQVDEPVISNTSREQRTLKDQNTTRRMAGEATRSTINNSVSNRNNASEGRSSAQVSARPASRPEQSQSVSSGRPASRPELSQSVSSGRPASRPEQSQSVSSGRPASRPEQRQSVSSGRPASRPEQSQSVSSGRPASRPEPSRNVSQSRPQVRSGNESVSSVKRSGGEEKHSNNKVSSSNERKSESASASRRK